MPRKDEQNYFQAGAVGVAHVVASSSSLSTASSSSSPAGTDDSSVDALAKWDVIMGLYDKPAEVFTPELHQYVAKILHLKLFPRMLRLQATSAGTNHNEYLWSMLIKSSHGKALNQPGTFTWYNFACLTGTAQNIGWPKTITGMLDLVGLDDIHVATNARRQSSRICKLLVQEGANVHNYENAGPRLKLHAMDQDEAAYAEALRLTRAR